MPQNDNTTPVIFPDLALTVPYSECLRYVQYRLKSFGHGELKPFCNTNKMPYTTIVNLKNGTLKREEHRLLARIMAALGIETSLYRLPVEDENKEIHSFIFRSKEELEIFRTQLKYFDDLGK